MKLKTFNQSNLPVMRTGKPTIRFSVSGGLITFSKEAGILMNLKDDSRVEFCQSESDPEDWYIHITEHISGFSLRRRDGTFSYTFNAISLTKKVLSSLGFEKGASFLISGKPREIEREQYWYIITGNPINAK